MSYRAEKNFKCNNVPKAKNEMLTEAEVSALGDKWIKFLLDNGLIISMESKKPTPRKKKTKKAIKPKSKPVKEKLKLADEEE